VPTAHALAKREYGLLGDVEIDGEIVSGGGASLACPACVTALLLQ
jgi:hypothetical protein